MTNSEHGSPPPERPQLSHNYTSDGKRVGGLEGGIYWIPASEFSAVLERRCVRPEILNFYRFEPCRRADR